MYYGLLASLLAASHSALGSFQAGIGEGARSPASIPSRHGDGSGVIVTVPLLEWRSAAAAFLNWAHGGTPRARRRTSGRC
jgi:hypothetical protein